jgi:hypothetical protein
MVSPGGGFFRKVFIRIDLPLDFLCKLFITKGRYCKVLFLKELAPGVPGLLPF